MVNISTPWSIWDILPLCAYRIAIPFATEIWRPALLPRGVRGRAWGSLGPCGRTLRGQHGAGAAEKHGGKSPWFMLENSLFLWPCAINVYITMERCTIFSWENSRFRQGHVQKLSEIARGYLEINGKINDAWLMMIILGHVLCFFFVIWWANQWLGGRGGIWFLLNDQNRDLSHTKGHLRDTEVKQQSKNALLPRLHSGTAAMLAARYPSVRPIARLSEIWIEPPIMKSGRQCAPYYIYNYYIYIYIHIDR